MSNVKGSVHSLSVVCGFLLAGLLFAGVVGGSGPVRASEPPDCRAWESGVMIAIRSGNAAYGNQYRMLKQRRAPEVQARRQSRESAQMEFWRSLRVQTTAIVDWSSDPELFVPMYLFANAKTDANMLRHYREAMALCRSFTTSDWPTLKLVP